jgi:hypothetical protein
MISSTRSVRAVIHQRLDQCEPLAWVVVVGRSSREQNDQTNYLDQKDKRQQPDDNANPPWSNSLMFLPDGKRKDKDLPQQVLVHWLVGRTSNFAVCGCSG